MKFYTHVCLHKQFIHHFYIENGKRKSNKVRFKPSLGVRSDKDTGWKDIYGNNVGLVQFENVFEMYQWKRENKDSAEIYNDVAPVYQFISQEYPQDLVPISFDEFKNMKVFIIDIEVYSTEGFPFPAQADFPVTAITVMDMYKGRFVTLACGDYETKDPNVNYIKCKDEYEILEKFINLMEVQRPDIITGWNTEQFDIPYLINRSKKLLEPGAIKRLSPIGEVSAYKISEGNEGYEIKGINHMDYIEVYKNTSKATRENYRLDTVAIAELGEGKLDYHAEFDNLSDLYTEDFQKYIDYNIRDVDLIAQMNAKLSFLETKCTQAFFAKANFTDTFGSVKIWDIMIYNELIKQKMLTSPKKHNHKQEFPGGFVLEPTPGLKKWLVVSDITSSYPNQIISGNISPETLVPRSELSDELIEIQDAVKMMDWSPMNQSFIDLEHEFGHFTDTLKQYDVSLLANGEFFTRNKEGIFPRLVANVFGMRKEKKREASVLKNRIKAEGSTEELENAYKTADALQYALKIFMNSFYGVFSQENFRYYDIRLASAVTTMGQLSIKGPAYRLEDTLPKLKVEYTDTDSLFIALDPFIKDRFGVDYDKTSTEEKRRFCKEFAGKIINPLIADYYKDQVDILNLYKNTYEMDFEAIADDTIFVGKKRYIMQLVHDDGYDSDLTKQLPLKKRGVELVRSNTPEYVRDHLLALVNKIFKTKDNNLCISDIDKARADFTKLSFEEVGRPTGVNGLYTHTYGGKSVPIHVRAVHVYNRAIKKLGLKHIPAIQEGAKIKYCYIKTPNIFDNENVIACENKMPDELKEYIQIDYDTQFKKTFESPASIIFKALGWNIEKIASLESFFD